MSTTVEIKSERTGFCRICQCFEDENMFDMIQGFQEVTENNDKLEITCEAFTRTTGIKLSPYDQSSRFVCENCFTRLKDFLLLRQEAEASRQKFTQIQDSPINESDSYLEEIVKVEGEETQKQCLICMGYDDEMTDIFSDIPLELDVENEKKLSHIFEEIVGISPSDYEIQDKFLCGECINRVIGSGMLRHQTLRHDTRHREESFAAELVDIKQENISCQICLKVFADQLEYESHLPCTSQTTSDRPYMCPDCGKRFGHYYTLKRHNMFVHSNERSHVCNICSKAFRYHSDLSYHVRIHSNERPYRCMLCSKTFKRSDALARHSRTHDPKREFICQICSKAFKQFGNLQEHLKVHSTYRPFVCNICSKSFRYSYNLTVHMNIHEINRPYLCSSCPKTFTNSRTLEKHLSVHSNDRPFICEICPKSFKDPSSLRKHKINHSNQDSQSYQCKFCPEIFTDERNLNIHVQMHTPNRKFICSTCSKSFPRSSALTSHLRVHSDERPFSCDSCGKTFKSSGDRTRHQRSHK